MELLLMSRVFRSCVPHLLLSIVVLISLNGKNASASVASYDDEPISYTKSVPNDSIARLQKDLASGKTKLKYDNKFGYLPALLDYLKISPKSQMLVFSKTSLQVHYITPETPRAI